MNMPVHGIDTPAVNGDKQAALVALNSVSENVIRTSVKLSDLKHGDTVEIDGQLKTVDKKYLKHDSLFGWSFEGAPYPTGITKIVFKVPTAFGFRYQ